VSAGRPGKLQRVLLDMRRRPERMYLGTTERADRSGRDPILSISREFFRREYEGKSRTTGISLGFTPISIVRSRDQDENHTRPICPRRSRGAAVAGWSPASLRLSRLRCEGPVVFYVG
jgi:hypothetical protein